MSRLIPFDCPHGVTMGGDESFGYSNVTCDECDREAHRYVRIFECSKCSERDAELSAMCVSHGCPKEHVGYTENVWTTPQQKNNYGK